MEADTAKRSTANDRSSDTRGRRIQLINSTLRDGVQALWSSRIATDEILPIGLTLDLAGYEAIDFMAPVTFEVSVKHLRENPWKRARAVRRVIRDTPLITHLRSRSLVSFDLAPDNVFELWVKRLAANGFRRAMVFDALHDIENLRFSTQRAHAEGLEVIAVLFFTISPFHTPAYYAAKATEIASLGADAICLRDPSGLLTPERTRELVTMIRKAVPDIPLEIKSHCVTGEAESCYIEAALCGVDRLFVTTEPLSGGVSIPAIGDMIERLASHGIKADIDNSRVRDEERYFRDLSEARGRLTGAASAQVTQSQRAHQMPGNMLAFTRDQLRSQGLEHKLPEVLDEFPRVRADMGYPVMVTPVSQLVCVQAVLNVLQGERYKSVPVEVRKYVHGAYGRLEAPVADALLERSGPAAALVPATEVDLLQQARDTFGTFESDDDLLLHVLFRPEQLEGVSASPAEDLHNTLSIGSKSIIGIISEIAKQGGFSSIEVQSKAFSFAGHKSASGLNH